MFSLIVNILLLGELMFFIDGAIYLEQINCTISYLALVFFYFGFCLIYFASSLKNNCRDRSWNEAFFNLIPPELLLLIFFASHHFIWSIVCLLLIAAAFYLTYPRAIPLQGVELEVVGQALFGKRGATFRSFAATVFAVLLIPACAALSYGFEPPVISSDAESPWQTSTEEIAITQKNWQRLDLQEKINFLQEEIDSFCSADKIERISIVAKPLPYEGGVDLEKRIIAIDMETLRPSDFGTVARPVFRGYYRCFMVSMTEENSGLTFQEVEEAFINERVEAISKS